MIEQETFINLCNLTTRVLGLPKDSLALKSRKQNLAIGRSIASVIGRMEDYTKHEVIADVLGRHRTLIYHYEKKHKNNYATWVQYRKAFNKVYIAYKNLESSKKSFLDDDFLKAHLLKKGVKENKKSQVFIEVKSGKAVCIIKTSYFDFSNQLESIKLALKNYQYEIKII
tara:strand:+ start:1423 stop:1932 length:510 start_codon:yes stop_codon:yes gene_type:complete